MSFFILGIERPGRGTMTGLGRGAWGRIQKQALHDTAQHWHHTILPRHFGTGNRARYRFEPRNAVYLKLIKPQQGSGQGRFVDLLLSGKSRRFLQSFATITGSKHRQTVTMRPPGYFTNPFIGTFRDERGRVKRVLRQPDKVAEVTRIVEDDRQILRRFCARRLGRLLQEARAI